MEKAERWLASTLDYEFNDPQLFRQALTHRSSPGHSNERLEFLGDAVLGFVITEIVFRMLPDADEGDLSRLRSSLVKDTSLAALASDLGLGDHLYLGGGERKSGGHRRESILADALEALFGAVYMDAGFRAASTVIEKVFASRLTNLPDLSDLRDAKTRLQEMLQARSMGLPEYDLVDVTGKAHKQSFQVRCSVPELDESTLGSGTSRRNAEQDAAGRMLLALAGQSRG
ncbi:MAG: ribonuclease III [Woeseiaceae bacterium]